MHFKNDNEMNSNGNNLTSAATSCSSSTDSGVIIIDNKTTFNNSNSIDNYSNNNSNLSNNDNTTTTLTTSKIAKDNKNEETTKNDDNATNNEILKQKKFKNNQNKSDKINTNNNKTNISIENIINISKAQLSDDVEAQKNWHNNSRNTSRSASKNCSPTVSIRSTSISIISIDENAIDSSIVDSDSECEADAEGVHSNYIVKKLGQQTTYGPDSPDLPNINKGLTVISQRINPNGNLSAGTGAVAENILNGSLHPPNLGALTPTTQPQIGSIALSNSTDVTFGDKHFYEGPVTIQQFLIDSREKWKSTDENGQDNPVFVHENNTTAAQNGGTGKETTESNAPHQPYKFIFNRKAVIITTLVIVSTILIGILIVAANYWVKSSIRKSKLIGDGDDSRKNIPINSTIDLDNLGSGKVLRIVPRDGWLAQPPSKPLKPLSLPTSKVIVLSTDTDDCTTQSACTYRVRILQTFNIEATSYNDIIYNFLIGGDGNVYEGRGWDFMGAHLQGFNDKSISLGFIGTFKKLKPNSKQMSVTKLLLEEGVRMGKLSTDYKIHGAQILDPNSALTAADALYDSFKSWPNWSDSP